MSFQGKCKWLEFIVYLWDESKKIKRWGREVALPDPKANWDGESSTLHWEMIFYTTSLGFGSPCYLVLGPRWACLFQSWLEGCLWEGCEEAASLSAKYGQRESNESGNLEWLFSLCFGIAEGTFRLLTPLETCINKKRTFPAGMTFKQSSCKQPSRIRRG